MSAGAAESMIYYTLMGELALFSSAFLRPEIRYFLRKSEKYEKFHPVPVE